MRREITFSLDDKNMSLPNRAGIAGIALVLGSMDSDLPIKWEITSREVKLSWECTDQIAIDILMSEAYQIDGKGRIACDALGLSDKGKYLFSEVLCKTFLQQGVQRDMGEEENCSFTVDDAQIVRKYRTVKDCYYTKPLDIFNRKGEFSKSLAVKSNHLPGSTECYVNGFYNATPHEFLPLLFLPLVCGYYQLPNNRMAVVIPEVTNIVEFLDDFEPATDYKDFYSGSSSEAALNFLVRSKAVKSNRYAGIDYCEVYQLGKQVWDANQKYLKQQVYRIRNNKELLDEYETARERFPTRVVKKDDGTTFLAKSSVLPWICDNLIRHKPWYTGFAKFRKTDKLYEVGGIAKMLEQHRGLVVNVVQDAFRAYLAEQYERNHAPYKNTLNKVIYMLDRPKTLETFRSTITKFLARNSSKSLKSGVGEFFRLIDTDWKAVKDLALLSVVGYKSQNTDDVVNNQEQENV